MVDAINNTCTSFKKFTTLICGFRQFLKLVKLCLSLPNVKRYEMVSSKIAVNQKYGYANTHALKM